ESREPALSLVPRRPARVRLRRLPVRHERAVAWGGRASSARRSPIPRGPVAAEKVQRPSGRVAQWGGAARIATPRASAHQQHWLQQRMNLQLLIDSIIRQTTVLI